MVKRSGYHEGQCNESASTFLVILTGIGRPQWHENDRTHMEAKEINWKVARDCHKLSSLNVRWIKGSTVLLYLSAL